MFLCARIIQNFIESIEEHDMARIEQLDDTAALDFLCEIYERSYGAKPSGVAMFLIKSKFKLNVNVAQAA